MKTKRTTSELKQLITDDIRQRAKEIKSLYFAITLDKETHGRLKAYSEANSLPITRLVRIFVNDALDVLEKEDK